MKTISRNILLDYIEHEEIAFQFGDGLICITHPNGNYADEQFVCLTRIHAMSSLTLHNMTD